ncbi:MAG: DNA primase [bacterium]|nr:DNA primase [bacterium]
MISSPIDDIKSRLDVVEVISSYIKLQKTGANWRAVCPFHSEKTPSFFVSPARQIWHCFGCGSGTTIFDFVMKIEGIEFGDALRLLAQKAGVELKPFHPESKELATARVRLYEILELACQFFEKQLEGKTIGAEARKYLLGRSISEESIKKWRLGYSPDVWQGLIDFLASRGYGQPEIENAGLAIKKDAGGFYDRFRGRIMFPIFDINSQVIGFGGRVFAKKDEKEIAKYINTPATLLYDKSRTLYGLDKGKVEVRKKDFCILVEGYTDAILSHQTGIINVVASSGTALTPWQLKILRRYTENLHISFDMDIAGDSATKRGIDLALSQGFNIKVIVLPEGKDPAELIAKIPQAWEKAIQEAKSILEFYFDSTLAKFDKSKVEGKKEISRIILPVIKKIPNKIEQTFWLQRLAKEINAREEDLAEEMAKVRLEEDVLGLEPEEIINLPQRTRRDLLEERLITLFMKSRKSCDKLSVEDLEFLTEDCRRIVSVFQEAEDNEAAMKKLDQKDSDKANYLFLKTEMLEEISEKDQGIDFKDCLREIKSMEIKSKLEKLSQELKAAESEKDAKKISSLVKEFHQITKKLSEI